MPAPSRSGARLPKKAMPTPPSTSARPIASAAACPTNLGAAQTWFERAAHKGHVDAQATLGLLLFQNGNRPSGLSWLRRPPSKASRARCWSTAPRLFNGDGVTQDPVLGYAYVSRAAAQGLAPAKETLAAARQAPAGRGPQERRRHRDGQGQSGAAPGRETGKAAAQVTAVSRD